MTNIIYDEKRTVRIGETCAIYLKDIHPVNLTLLNPEDDDADLVRFFMTNRTSVSSGDDITFINYLGHGMFKDLFSGQFLICMIFNEDGFGTDEYEKLDMNSKEELENMVKLWESIYNPKNNVEFRDDLSIFMKNPLLIDVEAAPFMTIDSEVAKKAISQSLEDLQSKMVSAKEWAQFSLRQQADQYEKKINDYYNAIDKSSKERSGQ